MERAYRELEVCRPHLIFSHIRSWQKYKSVLSVNCIAAIELDNETSPTIAYDIAKVAPVPVMRQVIVLTRLLFVVSI